MLEALLLFRPLHSYVGPNQKQPAETDVCTELGGIVMPVWLAMLLVSAGWCQRKGCAGGWVRRPKATPSLRLGQVQPGFMAGVDAAHGTPHGAVALEPGAEGNLPHAIALLHALLRLNACQHIPARRLST